MKNSGIISRILVVVGALAIITVSLSFTFSDTATASKNTPVASSTSEPVGGFVEDPK